MFGGSIFFTYLCNIKQNNKKMAKVKIEKRGNRHIIGKSLLYLVFNGCDYDVYDDGEYEGTYVGSIDTLKTMTENEAVDYIFGGL